MPSSITVLSNRMPDENTVKHRLQCLTGYPDACTQPKSSNFLGYSSPHVNEFMSLRICSLKTLPLNQADFESVTSHAGP